MNSAQRAAELPFHNYQGEALHAAARRPPPALDLGGPARRRRAFGLTAGYGENHVRRSG